MSDPKNPNPGDLIIDATGIAVVPLPGEVVAKLTKVHEGYRDAVGNVLTAKDEELAYVGIHPASVVELRQLLAEDDRLGVLLPAAEKLAADLSDTRHERQHRIAIRLGKMAAQVRRHADKDPRRGEVLGWFEKLLEYQFGPAIKGAATRERNARENMSKEGEEKAAKASKPARRNSKAKRIEEEETITEQ